VIQFPDNFSDADVTREMTKMYPAKSGVQTGSTGIAAPQGTESGFGATAKNFGKNAYQGAKGAITGGYDLGKDLVQNPNWFTGKDSTYDKFIARPAEDQVVKAGQELNDPQGSKIAAAGHALASAVPFVGPWAASIGDQAGKGDISGAAGQLVGGMGAAKLGGKIGGEMVDLPKHAVEFARRATSLNEVTKAGAGVYQGKIQPLIQTLRGSIQNEGARTIQQAIEADKTATKGMAVQGTISTAPAVAEAAKAIEDTGHTPTPQTQAVLNKLNNNPMISLEDAKNLRSDVGGAASKADRTGQAKLGKILWSAYDQLGEGMKGRIQELSGTTKPFDHYNNEFRAYYELNKGIAGDMQDPIQDRHESISKLKAFRDADLTEIKAQGSKYGMKPDDFDAAQAQAKSVVGAHDALSGKYNKSLVRLVMAGGGGAALGLSVYAAAHGAGLYGLAPMLAAAYIGSKSAGLPDQMETGKILRKLNVNPDSFQVRTQVEGPQNFDYPDQDEVYDPKGQAAKIKGIKSAR
jgi:hypothetical protein